MRKQVFGRQFKRDKNERKALFKSLMSSLVLNERIKTTEEKAKAIKGQIEKLVTKAKKRGEAIKDEMQVYLTSDAIKKLANDVAPRFKEINGGYIRIIKIGNRFSDNAKMAIIEWTVQGAALVVPKESKKRKQKETKGTKETKGPEIKSHSKEKPATRKARKNKEGTE